MSDPQEPQELDIGASQGPLIKLTAYQYLCDGPPRWMFDKKGWDEVERQRQLSNSSQNTGNGAVGS